MRGAQRPRGEQLAEILRLSPTRHGARELAGEFDMGDFLSPTRHGTRALSATTHRALHTQRQDGADSISLVSLYGSNTSDWCIGESRYLHGNQITLIFAFQNTSYQM